MKTDLLTQWIIKIQKRKQWKPWIKLPPFCPHYKYQIKNQTSNLITDNRYRNPEKRSRDFPPSAWLPKPFSTLAILVMLSIIRKIGDPRSISVLHLRSPQSPKKVHSSWFFAAVVVHSHGNLKIQSGQTSCGRSETWVMMSKMELISIALGIQSFGRLL